MGGNVSPILVETDLIGGELTPLWGNKVTRVLMTEQELSEHQREATPPFAKVPAWEHLPLISNSPTLLPPSSCLLPLGPHPGTCKVFPTEVCEDTDAGIDGVRVLTLADCFLLV